MKSLNILTVLLLLSFAALAQTNDKLIRLSVLRKKVVGKTFVFGTWDKESGTQTDLTYLGKIESVSGKTFKVMNSVWHWGMSHRLTSRILIFNKHNILLGDYYLTSAYDLPTSVENGYLIFSNIDNPDCDHLTISKVSFKKGIPKDFFRACKCNTGDIYSFSEY